MKHKMTPQLNLSKEQRKVAVARAMERIITPTSPPPTPPMGMPPPAAMPGMMPPPGMMPGMMPPGMPGAMPPGMPPGMPPQGMPPMGPDMSNVPVAPPAPRPMQEPPLTSPLLPSNEERSELTPVEMQLQAALIADQLWKDGGGSKSVGAEVWRSLMKKGTDGRHLETPRDYFISSFIKWTNDPVKFKKTKPTEARLLESLMTAFEETSGA